MDFPKLTHYPVGRLLDSLGVYPYAFRIIALEAR